MVEKCVCGFVHQISNVNIYAGKNCGLTVKNIKSPLLKSDFIALEQFAHIQSQRHFDRLHYTVSGR